MQKIEEIKNLILSPKDNILKAMQRLNRDGPKFQIIVNEKNKLLGTITDGDIRRSIMQGATPASLVVKCMNKNPAKGNIKLSKSHGKLLESVPSLIKFLPIVDSNNILKYVLLSEYVNTDKSVLIMAGGFGKRLGSITKKTPKPLLKIGNEIILEGLLKKLEKANFNNIYISTFYLHKKIEKFLKNRIYKNSNITLLLEDKPLGTAGSISLVPQEDRGLLMVINADVVSDLDFEAISLLHCEKLNDITLAVAKYSQNIPFGIVDFDKKLNFKSLREKPIIDHYILSGIYFLNKKVCNFVNAEYLDMTSLIEKAHLLNCKVGIYPIYESWKDIGNIEDFKQAENSLIRK